MSLGLAGCLGGGNDDETPEYDPSATPGGAVVDPTGVSMDALANVEGTLVVYSGRREGLVGPILTEIEDRYENLELQVRYGDSADLVGQIREEGTRSEVDLFYTQDAGTLGALKDANRTERLPDDVLEAIPERYRDPDGTWTGVTGRIRSIPYNTDALDAADVPDDIFAFPEVSEFDGVFGWAPGTGSFIAFVTAMRIEHGADETREWIRGMQGLDPVSYQDQDSALVRSVADSQDHLGFANHYYAARTMTERPEAPLDVAFTTGDAGALFNVAGAALIDSSANKEGAAGLVRHLLSTEAQEYFVETNQEYAVIEEIEYDGPIPSLSELTPMEFDLNNLSDVEPTLELMRDVDLL